jgi:lycopene beta-cyclase
MEREETGIVPIPMTSEYILGSVGGEPLPIGMRGGYFHATTGHAFADTVRVAEFFATLPELTTHFAREGLMKYRRAWLSRQRFYRLLNRMLFHAAEPALRYTVMQRFYEQQPEVIERFTSARTTWGDRARILSGKSPVPLERALRSLTERSIAKLTL